MCSTNFIKTTLAREADARWRNGPHVSIMDLPTFQSEYQASVGAALGDKAKSITMQRYASMSRRVRRDTKSTFSEGVPLGASRRTLPPPAPLDPWETEYKAACGASPRHHKGRFGQRSQQLSPTQKVQPREWDKSLHQRGRKDRVVADCVLQTEYMAAVGQQPEYKARFVGADRRHELLHSSSRTATDGGRAGRTVAADGGGSKSHRPGATRGSARGSARRSARRSAVSSERDRRSARTAVGSASTTAGGLFDIGRGVGLADYRSEYRDSCGAGPSEKGTYVSADIDDRNCHGPSPTIAMFRSQA
eukprot:g1845.t1